MNRARATVQQLVRFGVVAWLAACSDDQPGITEPPVVLPPSFEFVVSEPVRLTFAASAPGGSVAAAALQQGDSVTWVSLPTGTVPGGRSAAIRNLANGFRASAEVVDGGFDPVPLLAGVGDSVEVVITDGSGGTTRAALKVPARRPPIIVRTVPPKGGTDIPLNALIRVVFSEPMGGNTISSGTIKLLRNGQPVSGLVNLEAGGLLTAFHPAALLAVQTDYTLQITTGVADLSGDRLEQPVEVTFTTSGPGRIAFQSDRAGIWQIFVMEADGSGVVQLTTDPNGASGQSWSPDASRIAFISSGIRIMNADGTGVTRLTDGGDSDPAWSPDGSKIAFERCCGDLSSDIYVINVDGSGLRQLTSNSGFNEQPTWSPDGSKIAFVSFTGSGDFQEIYVMNSDGTGRTNVTNNPRGDVYPAWSPDGSKICFSTTRDGNTEIYVMNPDGTGLVNLTNNPARELGCSWSPDGSKIAFGTNRDGNLEIYVMNADGTGAVNLTRHPAGDEVPAWSRR